MLAILVFTIVAGAVLFSSLGADVNCGSQHWSCAGFAGIAVVAVSIGVGCALFLTACLALITAALHFLWPKTPTLESGKRTVHVAAALALAHIGVFGLLSALGLLPLGWLWWLGVFGFVGLGAGGQEIYLIQ